ncbi:hypothetical protein LUZ60_010557 [Juncus effusus]|nr:hypothetical protein LUZ60_010557 [Juncus effusus]
MSGGGEVRKVSRQDIQLVQNLIERCLQLYMPRSEVVDVLSYQAKIEPSFTELVWQKLEEENPEFFNAYYIRLTLKDQIVSFNQLLQDQFKLMSKEQVSAPPVSNGSNSSSLNTNGWNLSATISDTMIMNGGSSSSSGALINGSSSHQMHPHPLNPNPNPNPLNPPTLNPSSRSFNGGGANGSSIKTESGFNSNSDFGFCADPGFLDSNFSSSELTGQPLSVSDPILDMDPSFGFLSQIPRNFSFSDLTEDFSQSTEILENYGRSPFLPPEANNFSDSTGEGGNRRLDTISEGVTYEDFASD